MENFISGGNASSGGNAFADTTNRPFVCPGDAASNKRIVVHGSPEFFSYIIACADSGHVTLHDTAPASYVNAAYSFGTDNTDAINATIANAAAVGGVVICPPGNTGSPRMGFSTGST